MYEYFYKYGKTEMGYLLFEGSAVKSRMLDSTRDSSEMCVGSCAKKQNETKYTHTHTHSVSFQGEVLRRLARSRVDSALALR